MIKKYARAFYQSFYKPEIYREALIGWQGFGGRYMLFVAAFLAIATSISFIIVLHDFKKNELPYIIEQVPDITIEGGELRLDSVESGMIYNREKTMAIIIDPKKSESDFRAEKVIVGIGKNFILMRDSSGFYKSLSIAEVKNKLHLNQKTLTAITDNVLFLLSTFSYVLFFLDGLINLILSTVVVALISYVTTAYMQEEYNFVTRMRLAALALTPAYVIATILQAGVNHTVQPWFILLLACLYFYVMIILMRRLPNTPIMTKEEI